MTAADGNRPGSDRIGHALPADFDRRHRWQCDCGASAAAPTYAAATAGAGYHSQVTGHEFPMIEQEST